MPHDDPYRLARSVLPVRYDLLLEVDPDADGFDGTVGIDVVVSETVDRIVLNALDLRLGAVTVTADGRSQVPALVADVAHERVELHLHDPLPAGPARVEIGFSGPYCERLVGLYRSTFTVGDVDHRLAVTQFESTHARRAFPCFDEPDMKATFSVTLVVPDGLLAVSNAAELDRRTDADGSVRIRFADTMVMSTYLVAVVVGPLSDTGTRVVHGVAADIPLRVICPPGSEHLGAFALDVADAGIRFYEDYYDLPYPGDKVDLVAIPDFAFGAMENLGCITFREVALLVDPADVTQPELQRVADVVNHELAHMWFGDLVTMGWWNGIWLNEAFATFMEVTASDAFRPAWDTWTSFGLSRAAAFDTDSLPSTRPIEFPVESPEDADAMFDILTYEKGASVLRMLEQYLGAERFRDGIRSYLRAHAHANTETTDLWDDLEATTGEPIRRIMDAWIDQGGHPVVSAAVTDQVVDLTQAPATIADGPAPASGTVPRWPVPIVMTTSVGGVVEEHRVLLDGPRSVELAGPPSAVRLNTGGQGFFRSVLPAALRTVEAVAAGTTALERFVLLDDTWSGLLRGDVGVTELVDLVALLAWRETDPSVWRRIGQAIRDLRRLLGPDHDHRCTVLASESAEVPLGRITGLLDVAGGDDLDRWRDLRGVLVVLLGVEGHHAGVRTLAHDLFRTPPDEARRRPDVDSALLAAALDVVAATGGAEDHELIERRWRTATTPQDTIRHLYAMADTPDSARFDRTLELTLGEVRAQDTAYVLRRALANDHHAAQAWSFVSSHWVEVVDRVPAGATVRMFEGVRGVTDPGLAARISDFVDEHPAPGRERSMAQHVERMWITVRTAGRVRSEIDAVDQLDAG